MIENPSPIERVVMRRIHIIRVVRPLVSSGALSALVLAAALWGLGREVWVAKVFANGPEDFFGRTQYIAYALNHTRLVVQSLTLLTFASLIYLAREVARFVSKRLPLVYA
ncbi:hypothetical protein HYV30_00080 [Candidatus Kaiserbacteria bacterium]|nr:hypothetical protein [Candidatus Kaiserbacteria bacterium]